jgi:hypothetical protein
VTEQGVLQVLHEHAQELFDCLSKPNGLECDLVQNMTSPRGKKAEQFVSVLRGRPEDEQEMESKKGIEMFLWEYLANRTFTGEAQQAADGEACRHPEHPCKDGQVSRPPTHVLHAFLLCSDEDPRLNGSLGPGLVHFVSC